jgi:predicted nucleotidyltransferase
MKPTAELLHDRLQATMPVLRGRYGVVSLGMFGSYLRGTQRPDSDLDLLVSFREIPSLFRIVEVENFLSDLLGVQVDLVVREALKANIGKRILAEVEPV